MKIVQLKSENVKRLKAVEINPNGNTVVLSGKNAQGKTSVLDSIWFALEGKGALKDTPKPIREGEKKAEVTLDLGEYVVTRKWTANDKTYLSVENKEGASFKSPQTILDGLIGKLSFDPLEYLNMPAKQQLDVLLGLVDLSIDPDEIDCQIKAIYEVRTDIGRKGKHLSGQLEGMTKPAEDTPDDEIVLSDVVAAIGAAQEEIRKNNAARQKAEDYAAVLTVAEERVVDLQGQLNAAKEALITARTDFKAATSVAERLVDPYVNNLQEKLANAEETNRAVRNKRDYREVESAVNSTRKNYAAKTKEIEALQKEKSDALAAATFPVEGLSFDEGGVVFQGKPLTQASSAEQLRVSLGMAMAANPDLKVIHIKNGSLLDSENMAIIEEMAKDQDYQVWIEVVDETGKVGIYIEDGEVKGIN